MIGVDNMTIGIIGIGAFLPSNRVTNLDLEQRMDTSDEWIRTRTGIESRHLADADVSVGQMATPCGQNGHSRVPASPSMRSKQLSVRRATAPAFPATACVVQANLGANDAPSL